MWIARRLYTTGLDRNDQHLVAHLYRGGFNNVGDPMCARGWNRCDGAGFSIFRNTPSEAGLCKVCLRRAAAKRAPVKSVVRKTRWI
jgi:hypothetical protein